MFVVVAFLCFRSPNMAVAAPKIRAECDICIEIDYEGEGRDGVDWMHVAQDWVNTVRNPGVSSLAKRLSASKERLCSTYLLG